ncbi:MAG: site-2 protease family protein [Oscillospiraceae bacterium]|nr:site-2 protease family protein [Oscillospiraceae bacterium]
MLYILLAILIFGVLIAIHEFGHFATAKLCGVRVEEFAIGMGPALWKKQKGETLYALRAVPIGGYCALTGEDEASTDPRAFTNQAVWKRVLILCAGSFMNFLLGLLVVAILYAGATAFRAPILTGFMEGCPYEGEQALQVGDRFYKIDGHRIYQYYDVSDFLSKGDGTYDLVMIRDGKKVKLSQFSMEPLDYPGQEHKMYGFYFGYEEATFGVKLRYTWDTCMEFGRMVWMGLEQLLTGQVGVKDMSGPVGIVDMMAETGEQAASTRDALYDILYLGAFIAVNLAIMNMLPIPALDGGRVFLLLVTWLIESVTHKKLDPRFEGYIHGAGMVLLLALMAFVMFNDVLRIVTG